MASMVFDADDKAIAALHAESVVEFEASSLAAIDAGNAACAALEVL